MCSNTCYFNKLPKDPVEVSKNYLNSPNDINLFSFLCLYMIPVYEKITGQKNTMKKLARQFMRLMRQKNEQIENND